MFKEDLKEKYPFLTRYFEGAIAHPERSLAHSILLYGTDIKSQYDLAQEIARILNCKEMQNENCRCINCNWARNKEHPAVMTVSKLDNKPSDDESKTVISIAQSRMVKNSLLTTSDYHRVFIFCDAKIENGIWEPLGLNEANFHPETANSLLKIIEEPPQNVTFFFLARDKNDLISTIISRSQSFYVPSFEQKEGGFSNIKEIFENYFNFERKKSLDLAQELFVLSKEHGSEEIFDEIQNYLYEVLKSNLENDALKTKVLKDLKTVEIAKKQISARLNPQLAFEDMCLNMVE